MEIRTGNFLENVTMEDGAKMLIEFHRPKYRSTNGIGIWLQILDAMNIMAIITNMLLIGFSYDTLKTAISGDKKEFYVLVVVVVLEVFLYFFLFLDSSN